MKETLRSRES